MRCVGSREKVNAFDKIQQEKDIADFFMLKTVNNVLFVVKKCSFFSEISTLKPSTLFFEKWL
jgi:hypothetical protein